MYSLTAAVFIDFWHKRCSSTFLNRMSQQHVKIKSARNLTGTSNTPILYVWLLELAEMTCIVILFIYIYSVL